MKFTINNTALAVGAPPPRVLRVCEFLDAIPDGELLPYVELQTQMKVGRALLTLAKAHALMADYWTLAWVEQVHKVLFANPATIKAYNKEFKA